ncbi:MAG: signal recognition particle receptor subunit alpha [Candidatus Pacearchaeota archaeon]
MGFKEGLRALFNRIRNAIMLNKAELDAIIKDFEKTLIESDVDVELVLELEKKIKANVMKENLKAIEKKDLLTKLIYEELINILGEKAHELKLNKGKILLIGLYGSGKTTTAVKLANYYAKRGLRTAVISLDVHRPAAQEQLEQFAAKAGIKAFVNKEERDPLKIWKDFEPKLKKFDLVFIDSAGRDALNDELIKEIKAIYELIKPEHTLLVIPADIGQAAKKQATFFAKAIPIEGIILTRMDGTAKAGGALASCKEAGAKVYFIGVGEKVNDIEHFDPAQYVSRLLGLGDLKSLLEKIQLSLGEEEKKTVEAVKEGKFSMSEFYEQISAMQKLGPLSKIMEFIPGLSGMKIPQGLIDVQEKKLKHWKAAIDSMTKAERERPEIIDSSRLNRISRGSHVPISEIKDLLKQYKLVKEFVVGVGGGSGLSKELIQAMDEKKLAKLAKRFGMRLR